MVKRQKSKRRVANGTVALIRRHYNELGLSKWDKKRFLRLCALLHCTEYELGALVGIASFQTLDRFLNHDRFPSYIALHFALLENSFVEAVYKLRRAPVMPMHLLIK